MCRLHLFLRRYFEFEGIGLGPGGFSRPYEPQILPQSPRVPQES